MNIRLPKFTPNSSDCDLGEWGEGGRNRKFTTNPPSVLVAPPHWLSGIRRLTQRAVRAVWWVELIGKHFLFRLRSPRHPRLRSMLLLLLDPVQYELAPRLRSDKALTLRQKLSHFLVKRVVCPEDYRDGASPPETFPGISAPDPKRIAEALSRLDAELGVHTRKGYRRIELNSDEGMAFLASCPLAVETLSRLDKSNPPSCPESSEATKDQGPSRS